LAVVDGAAAVGVFRLRSFMDASIMRRKGKASGGGVGRGASRPNGINRDRVKRQAVVAKRMGRKSLPSPIEPSGRAVKAHRTRNIPGIDAERDG
jgi:hypothetical protein